jgi:hypothetical protein
VATAARATAPTLVKTSVGVARSSSPAERAWAPQLHAAPATHAISAELVEDRGQASREVPDLGEIQGQDVA